MCNDGCFCCFWFLSVYTLQRNFIIAASLSLLPCDSTASLPWYATPGLYLTAHYICLLECATNSDFRYIYKSIASQVMGNYCHLWQHMHTCRPYVHSSLVSKCLRRAAYDLCAPVSATIARRCSFLSLYVLLHVATWWSRYRSRSFADCGPTAWNSLPAAVRDFSPSSSSSCFCSHLKTELFRRAYGVDSP